MDEPQGLLTAFNYFSSQFFEKHQSQNSNLTAGTWGHKKQNKTNKPGFIFSEHTVSVVGFWFCFCFSPITSEVSFQRDSKCQGQNISSHFVVTA